MLPLHERYRVQILELVVGEELRDAAALAEVNAHTVNRVIRWGTESFGICREVHPVAQEAGLKRIEHRGRKCVIPSRDIRLAASVLVIAGSDRIVPANVGITEDGLLKQHCKAH